MDNEGLLLTSGELYTEKREIKRWMQLNQDRPEDARVLSSLDPLDSLTLKQKLGANERRVPVGNVVNSIIKRRFQWTPDKITFGTPDHWASFKEQCEDRTTNTILGDCDNYSVTAMEYCLELGIDPRHLYISLCLSGGGQSTNRYRPKSERIWINHCVSGVMDDDGEFWIFDSSHTRTFRKASDTRHDWCIWHRMDWALDEWRYTEYAGK